MEAATVRIVSSESRSHYDSVFWFPASIFPLIAASYSGFLFMYVLPSLLFVFPLGVLLSPAF